MENYSHCPQCNSNWHYQEIPEDIRDRYSPPYFYSKVVACSSWGYDRTLYWMCPDCYTKFNLMGQVITDQ